MQYTTLGRTGLRVSVAGLGSGGFSRLGLGTGRTAAEAVSLVRLALDLGVNFIDTAAVYGTESIVGEAIRAVPRDSVVIATKALIPSGHERSAPDRVVASLDNSLRQLGTDYVDVFQLHAVQPGGYALARDIVAPVLLREMEKGKFRHLGITETAPADPGHRMLQLALADDIWDVVMVAFHMLHQNARRDVFPQTLAQRVGTLAMFVVRNIFSKPERLQSAMRETAAEGQLPPALAESTDPLGFLIHPDGAGSLAEAAYRFVRHEPGVDVVLFGTGDPDHMRANIDSILSPPLPEADRRQLAALFGHLVGVGLDRPERATRSSRP
jgi:aryl-alcohol dehydrogenase-like predicted oxidoreductase